jgi:hypothetical protein
MMSLIIPRSFTHPGPEPRHRPGNLDHHAAEIGANALIQGNAADRQRRNTASRNFTVPRQADGTRNEV